MSQTKPTKHSHDSPIFVGTFPIDQGKSRWDSYHLVVYLYPCTSQPKILGPCIFSTGYFKWIRSIRRPPWHFLYFLPLPQGHGSFAPTLVRFSHESAKPSNHMDLSSGFPSSFCFHGCLPSNPLLCSLMTVGQCLFQIWHPWAETIYMTSPGAKRNVWQSLQKVQ